MRIKILKQKQASLLAEGRALFATADTEQRGLTEAESARETALNAELDGVEAEIKTVEAQMERQRRYEPNKNAPADPSDPPAPKDGKKFSSLGDQMMAVCRASLIAGGRAQGVVDPRLSYVPDKPTNVSGVQAATGLSEGISADGGFLVQTDFLGELLQNTYEMGQIAQRIRKIPIGANSNGIKVNGVDETSRVNGSRWGGIQSYWTAEAAAFTASQPKFRKITMELEKLTGLCYATDELLADSVALEAWLNQAFSDEFVFKIEDAILNGTGAGMPLGILNSGCVITVNKETSQPTLTLVAENILKMWSRLPARLRNNAVWLINQDVEPQLYQLNVKIKNVAGSENVGGIAIPSGVVFTPPGTNGNQFGTLMGRPVVPVEYCASLTTAGDIILADLSQYLAIDKGTVNAQSSMHVRFLFDEMTFRFVYRFNGQPIWQTALTPYKGTNTQSPFIVLQSR